MYAAKETKIKQRPRIVGTVCVQSSHSAHGESVQWEPKHTQLHRRAQFSVNPRNATNLVERVEMWPRGSDILKERKEKEKTVKDRRFYCNLCYLIHNPGRHDHSLPFLSPEQRRENKFGENQARFVLVIRTNISNTRRKAGPLTSFPDTCSWKAEAATTTESLRGNSNNARLQ